MPPAAMPLDDMSLSRDSASLLAHLFRQLVRDFCRKKLMAKDRATRRRPYGGPAMEDGVATHETSSRKF